MGLFRKKQKDNPTALEMKSLAEKAVEYGKRFNYDFDYKRESIEELEEVLDKYEPATKKICATDEEIWELSLIFGAYLGEVLLRTGLKHAGFVWVDENGIPILKKNEQTKVSPISKVFKRLKNGKEDNIKPFFDIGICIAQQESKFKIK